MASRISRSSRRGSWVSGVGAATTASRSPEQGPAEDGMPSGAPWGRRRGSGVVGMSRRPFVCSAGLAGSTPGVLPAPHLPRPEPAAARRVPSSYAIGGVLSTGLRPPGRGRRLSVGREVGQLQGSPARTVRSNRLLQPRGCQRPTCPGSVRPDRRRPAGGGQAGASRGRQAGACDPRPATPAAFMEFRMKTVA